MMRLPEWLNERWHAIWSEGVRMLRWARQSGPFYVGSTIAHGVAVLVVLSWSVRDEVVAKRDTPDEIDTEIKEPEVARFIIGTPPIRLTELTARSLALTNPPAQTKKRFDDTPLFEDAGGGTRQAADEPQLGGLGGFVAAEVARDRVKTEAENGIGIGLGTSNHVGSGGPEDGFSGLGRGERPTLDGSAEAAETERAVAAALNWLRRHQHDDGSWSLTAFAHHCQGETCPDACDTKDDVLATGLGLLAFLAAGETHAGDGPYQRSLARAVEWLLTQQATDGGFVTSSAFDTLTHNIVTLALCEAYSMTDDPHVGEATQRAVQCIDRSWSLGADGWQWAAVTSAQRAGLTVDPVTARQASDWLAIREGRTTFIIPVSDGASRLKNGQPKMEPQKSEFISDAVFDLPPVITPIELFRAKPIPDPTSDDVIDCFVARGRSRNHEQVRRNLLATQSKTGCTTGSWPEEQPADVWMVNQGRFPTTCFAAILLAASYHRLPMHKMITPRLARTPKIGMDRK